MDISRKRFTLMQKFFYRNGTSNHEEHNDNPHYWQYLLAGVNSGRYDGKRALDFGCGKGRNISNLMKLANWDRVDGSDISSTNIKYCRDNFDRDHHDFYLTSGQNVGVFENPSYDFIMSTIVLQHIPVHEIRFSIVSSAFAALKPGGRFSFQMGFGEDLIDSQNRPKANYHANEFRAASTNGNHDVRITNPNDVLRDLAKVGFSETVYHIGPSFSDFGHPEWIYFSTVK
jgi:SAM-dependent methyltransferase